MDKNWFRWINAVCVIFGWILSTDAFSGCPKSCFCNVNSQIVYCSRRGLPALPEGIPDDTKQVNMNGNIFRSPSLHKSNFSSLPLLEHLYLSECGIESLGTDTFSDLKNLKWLDLSNNQLHVIQDYTFRGISLQNLFLNGNRGLQLQSSSLSGLRVNGLYLHDCGLQDLQPDALRAANDTIRYLWLNGNELETLDRGFLPIFRTLSHLRLGTNPLHCNCQITWIKEFLDKNSDIFEGASPPSCLTPQRMRGRYFDDVALFDFQCQAPVFNNIDALFNENEAKLRCTATGDPAPDIFWIRPTGESKRYMSPLPEDLSMNEGLLTITKPQSRARTSRDVSSQVPFWSHGQQARTKRTAGGVDDLSGMYICFALNEAGNVTLTLNVTWPSLTPMTSSATSYLPSGTSLSPLFAHTLYPNPFNSNQNPNPIHNDARINDVMEGTQNVINNNKGPGAPDQALDLLKFSQNASKRFTMFEIIGAVVGTHVCTLLLCIIVIPLFVRKQWKKKHRAPSLRNHKTYDKHDQMMYLGNLYPDDYLYSRSPLNPVR